ncbi:MAG: hypothetical protein Kow0089_21590 [Desulfobulbaceae bacterium]
MIAEKRPLFVSITCLGMSALITQVVTLREFLTVFAGNELVLGMVLGNWLLLSGAGAFCGSRADRLRRPMAWLVACQAAVALLPLLHVALVRMLPVLSVPGEMAGLQRIMFFSLLVLSPYCLVTGFLLTLFSGLWSRRREAVQIGEVYVLDLVGDILGGLLFSFLLVLFLTTWETLALLMVVNLLAAAWVGRHHFGNTVAGVMLAVLAAAGGLFFLLDPEEATTRMMFPGQEVVSHRSTPYGRLVVTRSGEQTTVFENGIAAGTTGDLRAAEESVHYALAQHPHLEDVLLVSGGLNGGLREASRYPLRTLDYVEIDPAVLRLARDYGAPENDDRIRYISADARRYLRVAHHRYDAILMRLPDPSTARLNRYYTVEFFREVRRALKPDGVFGFSLSGAENYANRELRYLSASVYHSLADVFPHILVIPGDNQYFLASGSPLTYEIGAALERKGMVTHYVTDAWLRSRLTRDRIEAAREMVRAPAALNEDFRPAGYFMLTRFWLSRFQEGLLLPVLFMGGLFCAAAVLAGAGPKQRVKTALCASGFAGMGLEVVLLIGFQVCFGSVYHRMGLLITGFLAGTALGGFWAVRKGERSGSVMLRADLLLTLAAAGAAILLSGGGERLATLPLPLGVLVFTGVIFLVGFLVGAQFPAASRLAFQGVERTAGALYTLDYLGAALGGLLVSVFCIPLLGIVNTCLVLAGIKLVTSALLWSETHRAEAAEEGTATRPVTRPVLPAAATLLVLAVCGLLVYLENTWSVLYSLTFRSGYHLFLLLLAVLALAQAVEADVPVRERNPFTPFARSVFTRTKIHLFRWLTFGAFSLVVFFPLFRCYFRVPYLFCHVCPRQCVFGFLRPSLVPAALLMNLDRRFWCLRCCPLGTLFDCQALAAGTVVRVPRKVRRVLQGLLLGFTGYGYFRIRTDLAEAEAAVRDWYTFFFTNTYAPVTLVIAVVLLVLIASFRVRRLFCDTFCPVGAFSVLVEKTEQRLTARPHAVPERGVGG